MCMSSFRDRRYLDIYTQTFNRSLEMCEVPSCFNRYTVIPAPKKPPSLDWTTTVPSPWCLWSWSTLIDCSSHCCSSTPITACQETHLFISWNLQPTQQSSASSGTEKSLWTDSHNNLELNILKLWRWQWTSRWPFIKGFKCWLAHHPRPLHVQSQERGGKLTTDASLI